MRFSDKIPTFIRLSRFLWERARKFPRWLFLTDIGTSRFLWKWLKRLARPVFFTVVCLVTLVALVIAEENYRTGKAWEKYKEEAKARGVKFSMAELAPPPVPDDQNFAMTPLLKPIYSDSAYEYKLRNSLTLNIPSDKRPYFDWWAKVKKLDLAAWSAYFQRPEVLQQWEKHDAELAEISAAVRRPSSRFPVTFDYQPPDGGLFTISPLLRRFSELYELRGLAELGSGKNEAALADTITLFRLAQTTRGQPLLGSQFFLIIMLRDNLQIVWEGLARRSWTEAQLTELQQEIQKVDVLAQLLQAEQGERIFYTGALEWVVQQDGATRARFFGLSTAVGQTRQVSWFSALSWSMSGFLFNRELLAGNEYYDQYALPAINLAERRYNPDFVNAAIEKYGKDDYLVFMPAMNKIIAYSVSIQASLDEASIACALERFRLAHGNFPENLDELVPQYIAQLPHDLITGKPLHYQRTDDGNFDLYSSGWKGPDEYGKVSEYGANARDENNWVWRYPAK